MSSLMDGYKYTCHSNVIFIFIYKITLRSILGMQVEVLCLMWLDLFISTVYVHYLFLFTLFLSFHCSYARNFLSQGEHNRLQVLALQNQIEISAESDLCVLTCCCMHTESYRSPEMRVTVACEWCWCCCHSHLKGFIESAPKR